MVLEFTHFAVDGCGDVASCTCDYLKILDKDGTTLMDESCGNSMLNPSHPKYFRPSIIWSKTNSLDVIFHTDDHATLNGWSLNWVAVKPGETAARKRLSFAKNA